MSQSDKTQIFNNLYKLILHSFTLLFYLIFTVILFFVFSMNLHTIVKINFISELK
jgi:hypothetical protein